MAIITRAPTPQPPKCPLCDDSGFVRGLECAGDGECGTGRCGQPWGSADPHTYTQRCACRATNPVLLKARETLRAMAPKAQKTSHERA